MKTLCWDLLDPLMLVGHVIAQSEACSLSMQVAKSLTSRSHIFSTRSDTDMSVQKQKMARGLKFQI